MCVSVADHKLGRLNLAAVVLHYHKLTITLRAVTIIKPHCLLGEHHFCWEGAAIKTDAAAAADLDRLRLLVMVK